MVAGNTTEENIMALRQILKIDTLNQVPEVLQKDGSNYPRWKRLIRTNISEAGLASLLEDNTDKDIKPSVKDEDRLYSFINRCIHDDIKRNTMSCDTARDLWMLLESRYKPLESRYKPTEQSRRNNFVDRILSTLQLKRSTQNLHKVMDIITECEMVAKEGKLDFPALSTVLCWI